MNSTNLLAVVDWGQDRTTRRVVLLRTLTEGELRELQQSTKAIRGHEQLEELFDVVRLNFVSFGTFLGQRLRDAVAKKIAPSNMKAIAADANRQILNFLTTVRTYLDHTERRAKHDADPGVARDFKVQTGRFYDEFFSYRFMWRLRNFVQHCGMPVARVVFRQGPSSDSTNMSFTHSGHGIGLYLDRDELIDSFDGWGSAIRDELSHLPKDIEVSTHVSVLFDCIKNLHADSMARSSRNIAPAATFLRQLIGEACSHNPGGKPIIITSLGAGSTGLSSIEFEPLPLDVVRALKPSDAVGTSVSA